MLTRRNMITAMAATGLCPSAMALGPTSRFDVAEIMLPSNTTSRPGAWQRALFEVMQSTSIEAIPRAVQISPEDPELFAHPFAVLIGTGGLAPLSKKAAAMLLRYVSYGGFLFFDDATANPNGDFFQSVRRIARRLFPTRAFAPIRGDHSLYRSFFLLDKPLGRVAVRDVLEGVQVGEVTPLMYCPNDLSGALDRGPDGRDLNPVIPGGESQRIEAVKLAINLVMYSLTSNYKHDQAHVKQLILEGRL